MGAPLSAPFPVSLGRKEAEPFNARGEPSVVVYLHNLWGSKNAKKLISRPRSHRFAVASPRLSSSFQSRLHLLTTFVSFHRDLTPSSSSSSSSSFARVCPSAISPGSTSFLRSFVSRLFPQVRINFYLVCGIRNLFRDILSLLVFFFLIRRPWPLFRCDFITSWQEARINLDVVSLPIPPTIQTYKYVLFIFTSQWSLPFIIYWQKYSRFWSLYNFIFSSRKVREIYLHDVIINIIIKKILSCKIVTV